MTTFNGNCEECGSYTSTYCNGSLVVYKLVMLQGVLTKERVILCPVCAKAGKKKIKTQNRKMKGVK